MSRYFGGLAYTWQMSGVFGWLLLADWAVFPFAVHAVIYPSRALNIQNWAQGRAIESYFSQQAMVSGEVMAIIALVVLSLFQLGVTVMIYRRAQTWVAMWPFALFLIAGGANLIWWWQTGHFDLLGALIGATPFASGVLWQTVCEKWGADFVFGKDNRPQFVPGLNY
jgi:hypothetical protein